MMEEESDAEDGDAPELVEVDEEDSAMPDQLPPSSEQRIPVTIITGFLGAGKSTLLNSLLRTNHGKRMAIIENEFSAGLGIEGMIAKSGVDNSNLDGFFELNNGCICCTVKDSLLVTLEQLVRHRHRFDYIVIETTGVANPGPVVTTFWTDDALGSCLKLDGVVCVVDCANLWLNLSSPDTDADIRTQVGYADRILLNKTDLVSALDMPAVEAAVRAMNSVAEVRFTTYADASPDWVLDIDCYSLQTGAAESDDNSSSGPRCLPCLPLASASASASVAGSGPGAAQSPLHSASSLSSVALVIAGRLSLTAVKSFLDALLYNNGNNAPDHQLALPPPAAAAAGPVRAEQGQGQGRVFRIKGALHVTGPQCTLVHVLQAVHDVFDIQPSTFLCGGEGDTTGGMSRFVFIGRSLDEAALKLGLQGCVEVEW